MVKETKIFNILTLADLHWGSMEARVHASHYEFIFDFIELFNEGIDLIVLAGDYWDSRIMLNSEIASTGTNWLERLLSNAKKYGVKKIRMIRGTKEHDNDQLEPLRCMEDGDFFRIFIENTFEETLPGLRVIYCPEENMKHNEYIDKYSGNIAKFPNIGFFHGNLDAIMPSIARKDADKTNTLIYQYQYWHELIQGPMIAGHWHIGQEYQRWIYVGTPDCWEFGQDDEKGVGFLSYNIEENSYFYHKITNPIANIYEEFIVDTSFHECIEDYQDIINLIDKKINEFKNSGKKFKIKITIRITDEKEQNERLISHLKLYYSGMKHVKIAIKDKLQKKRKNEERKRHEELRKKYHYIKDPNLSKSEIIRQHILSKHEESDFTVEEIKEVIIPYLPDGKD